MKTRVLTIAALAVFAGLLIVRNSVREISASDSENITWGATDPTWSPDGSRLAFSLFGSIWQVSANGGAAEQITTGPGYHAHPAWSPKGDQIVFISGNPPAGRIPNISGKLKLVEVSTGNERELATPHPTAGSPAWSPDGARIAVALQVPNAGALLHEIGASDGKIVQMQQRMQSGPEASASAGRRTTRTWRCGSRTPDPGCPTPATCLSRFSPRNRAAQASAWCSRGRSPKATAGH